MQTDRRCPTCATRWQHTTEYHRLHALNLLLFAYAIGAATQPLLHRLVMLIRW